MNIKESDKLLSNRWPEIVLILLFFPLGILLNTQFMDGSNINSTIAGHDEYIAVKEVYSILHPISLKHFFMALISGSILFYGRIMFYLDALIAFIPFKNWGVTGMVMAVRLTHTFLIIVSVRILANTFLENNWKKIVFYVATLGTYYSMYFMMMPKPEPWQMLFLALFLKYFKQSEWQFGRHFILLGIAYGLKFNVLLLLPVLFLVPVIRYGLKSSIKKGLISIVYLISGLIIAIPCLLLSPLKPVFLKTYLHETFGGTSKVYDDANIGIADWMKEYGGSYLGMNSLSYPFILFALIILILSIKKEFGSKDYKSSILLISGFVLFAAIVILTKRTWPHYLWTSHILFVLGILVFTENYERNAIGRWSLYLQLVFTGICFFFFLYRELPLFATLSKNEDAVKCGTLSRKAMDYLNGKSSDKGYIKIATDGSVLYPFEEFVKVDPYHPFASKPPEINYTSYTWYWDFPEKIWTDSNDYIIFYKRHPELLLHGNKATNQGKAEELMKLFDQHAGKDYAADTSFDEMVIYKRK